MPVNLEGMLKLEKVRTDQLVKNDIIQGHDCFDRVTKLVTTGDWVIIQTEFGFDKRSNDEMIGRIPHEWLHFPPEERK